MFSRGGSLLLSICADARYIDAAIVSKALAVFDDGNCGSGAGGTSVELTDGTYGCLYQTDGTTSFKVPGQPGSGDVYVAQVQTVCPPVIELPHSILCPTPV